MNNLEFENKENKEKEQLNEGELSIEEADIEEQEVEEKDLENDNINNEKNIKENEDLIKFNIPYLYDRLLIDNRFLKYKELIIECKNKKLKKRANVTNDDDDIKIFPELNHKKKITYPKSM